MNQVFLIVGYLAVGYCVYIVSLYLNPKDEPLLLAILWLPALLIFTAITPLFILDRFARWVVTPVERERGGE